MGELGKLQDLLLEEDRGPKSSRKQPCGQARLSVGRNSPEGRLVPKTNLTCSLDFHRSDSDILMFSWQVTVEDFEMVCKGLYRALCIREKYMQKSFQRFPKTPSKYLRNIEGEAWVANESFYPGKKFSHAEYKIDL